MLLSTPTIGHSASPRTKPLGPVGQQAWFPQLSGPFDVMTQGHTICCDSSCLEMSTTNWHLPRALPMTEQQRHLPSASMEIEPHAAITVDLNTPGWSSWWSEASCAPGNLVGQVFRWMFLGTDFIISILASPHI